MPDLNQSFQEILENRQSNRSVYIEKLETVRKYATTYNEILTWITTNRSSLESFNADLREPINVLETFSREQITRIEKLVSCTPNDVKPGKLQNLLSRIERSWISFSAIGAKRQGKGHMLSTLLNLKPENDIFLARAGKPCTASVVTLYQGCKREASFNVDGSFSHWENVAENKAFVYFHTYDSIEALIQQYITKLGIPGTFTISQKTKEGFKATCDRWLNTVETFTSNSSDVEYKELLIDYLRNSSEYAKYLNASEDSMPKDIDVLDLPLTQATEKVDFVNPELRKFISYYRRDDNRKYFDVLAVKNVDIYTNFSIGSLNSESFVISDTAGIGEAKLNLRETLKNLLRDNIDIALAVTEVPDNSNEDLSLPSQVIDFHNTISEDECFVCFPLQFYYIVNVRQSTIDSKSQDDINDFKDDLINHLKNRGLPLPVVNTKKPWAQDQVWTRDEVKQWMDSHVKILNTDDYNAINEYFENKVLPNVANDINIIDSQLLSYVDSVLEEIGENDNTLAAKCQAILSLIPIDEADYYEGIVREINKHILSVLKEDLDKLSKAIASIKDLSDTSNLSESFSALRPYQKDTLNESINLLRCFQSKIEEFYCEPDSYRTIRSFNSDFNIREIDRKACAQLKQDLYGDINNNSARKKEEKWESTEWREGIERANDIKLSFENDLVGVLEALNADEIGKLAIYRLKVANQLKESTDCLLTDLAMRAYALVVNMIWKSICEDGKFDLIRPQMNLDNIEQEIMSLFADAKYKPVYEVLEKINATELCVTDKSLRKDLHHKLAASRIQQLIINQPNSEHDVPRVLAEAFWNHLIAIEKDYKECVASRFKKESILHDFRFVFMKTISQTSQCLTEHDVHANEPCQKKFLNFYINHFQQVLPENDLQLQQIVKKCSTDLKNIIEQV